MNHGISGFGVTTSECPGRIGQGLHDGASLMGVTADGRTYHFRSRDYRTIAVLDSFKHGALLVTVETAQDAEGLVARIATGRSVPAATT
jgi:hypothetical protein